MKTVIQNYIKIDDIQGFFKKISVIRVTNPKMSLRMAACGAHIRSVLASCG